MAKREHERPLAEQPRGIGRGHCTAPARRRVRCRFPAKRDAHAQARHNRDRIWSAAKSAARPYARALAATTTRAHPSLGGWWAARLAGGRRDHHKARAGRCCRGQSRSRRRRAGLARPPSARGHRRALRALRTCEPSPRRTGRRDVGTAESRPRRGARLGGCDGSEKRRPAFKERVLLQEDLRQRWRAERAGVSVQQGRLAPASRPVVARVGLGRPVGQRDGCLCVPLDVRVPPLAVSGRGLGPRTNQRFQRTWRRRGTNAARRDVG